MIKEIRRMPNPLFQRLIEKNEEGFEGGQESESKQNLLEEDQNEWFIAKYYASLVENDGHRLLEVD